MGSGFPDRLEGDLETQSLRSSWRMRGVADDESVHRFGAVADQAYPLSRYSPTSSDSTRGRVNYCLSG